MSNILLDMDGVIANFSEGIQGWIVANGEQRMGLSEDQIAHIRAHPSTCWSMYRVDWGLDFTQFDKAVRMATDEGMWVGLDPIDNSLDVVDALHLAGHEIHVVSTPWGSGVGDPTFHNCAIQKMSWLGMYAVPAVSARFGHQFKQSEDLKICIEDRIENVVDFARTGRPVVCHARPWNDPVVHADVWAGQMAGEDLWPLIIRTDWAGVSDAVGTLLAS
jgi:hypothetical protein